MLPSPFPKLLLWSPAGGVTPQAEKDGQSPGEHGGRWHAWPCSGIKKRPVTTTGRFCIGRVGDRAGRVSSTVYHGIHLGQSGAAVQGAGGGQRDAFAPCKKSSSRLAVLHPKTGTCMQIGRKGFGREGKGRPGAARRAVPVTTKEVTGIETGWREDLFPEKVSLPLSFPFESDVTTYSCARPMPDRAASRPAPRRKRPASSKALPMSCMPTGILLSAAMPTGRDRPGRPARFRDRV